MVGPVAAAPLPEGSPDEHMNPVVHLANFALPPDRGDYGVGRRRHHGRQPRARSCSSSSARERRHGAVPVGRDAPDASCEPLRAEALQRRLPGQLGYQRFFTEADRAFSLFVVLGGARQADKLCTLCNDVLAATRIEPS